MEQAIYITLILGLANTIYLTYTALAEKAVYCLFLPNEWCVKVQHSKYSKTFGIRNPYLGLGMLIAITALFFLSMNLLGITGGATLVALCTDYVFKSEAAVGYSISIITALSGLAGGLLLAWGL